jgi:hypothetical protein
LDSGRVGEFLVDVLAAGVVVIGFSDEGLRGRLDISGAVEGDIRLVVALVDLARSELEGRRLFQFYRLPEKDS